MHAWHDRMVAKSKLNAHVNIDRLGRAGKQVLMIYLKAHCLTNKSANFYKYIYGDIWAYEWILAINNKFLTYISVDLTINMPSTQSLFVDSLLAYTYTFICMEVWGQWVLVGRIFLAMILIAFQYQDVNVYKIILLVLFAFYSYIIHTYT